MVPVRIFSMPCGVIHLEVPVDQVEEESDEPEEVDEDEADEDSLGDPYKIIHGASLKC